MKAVCFRWAAVLLALCGNSWAQTTELVSVAQAGGFANDASLAPRFSADAQFVGFYSYASNLSPQDTNFRPDVFLRNLSTSQTERVSLGTGNVQADGSSFLPALSADARYVVFQSQATNLVSGDTNAVDDIFMRDRSTSATTRLSVSSAGLQANQPCKLPELSADGRYVVFESAASSLIPGDANGVSDIFLHDTWTHLTTVLSVNPIGAPGNAPSRRARIDASGRWVVFESMASDLVPGDTNGVADVFLRDVLTGTTERVSLGDAGQEAQAACTAPCLSGNGRFVSFESFASNLVAADTGGFSDVFVRDVVLGTTVRVSVSSSGVQGDGVSGIDCCVGVAGSPLSYDGRTIAFLSLASSLFPGDTDGTWDVYVHDLLTHETTRASLGGNGQEGTVLCIAPAISSDGRRIMFCTEDPTLLPGDNNITWDVFLRDVGPAQPFAYCAGDGSSAACPCGNTGLAGRGCENSRGTGGAFLSALGESSLSSDTLSLAFTGASPTALVILFQGTESDVPAPFADGLRCVGGRLVRVRARVAVGGYALFPEGSEPSISARSAAIGDPIPIGATRHYQAFYRDADPMFCPAGGTANASQALGVLWRP